MGKRERSGEWDLDSEYSHVECFARVYVCVCVCQTPPLLTAVCPDDEAVSSACIFVYFTN